MLRQYLLLLMPNRQKVQTQAKWQDTQQESAVLCVAKSSVLDEKEVSVGGKSFCKGSDFINHAISAFDVIIFIF